MKFKKLKPKARESFLKCLSAYSEHFDFELSSLNDIELRDLYNKFQASGGCRYKVLKGKDIDFDFDYQLVNRKLQYVSFRNTPGVRNMTFIEYLKFLDFIEENPNVYPHFY